VIDFPTLSASKRIVAWIYRFIHNLRSSVTDRCLIPHLMISELSKAEDFWVAVIQRESFLKEIDAIKQGEPLPKNSKLLPLRFIWDSDRSVICVGGRMSNSSLAYSQTHPVILDGKHLNTKIIIRSEHSLIMHAGPTLLLSSLSQPFHIIGARKTILSIVTVGQCVICRRHSIKPQNQLLGQLELKEHIPRVPWCIASAINPRLD
jgi:hypothetical protein